MKKSVWILVYLSALGFTETRGAELNSPDGEVVATVELIDGMLSYSVAYRNKLIVIDSGLGLEIKGVSPRGFRITNLAETKHDDTWKPVYGEQSEIRDRYHQLVVDLEDDQVPPLRMQVTFRAYNEGAAFCYTLPEQTAFKSVELTCEKSEFRFSDDYKAWAVYSAQGRYEETRLSGIKAGCERPLVLEIDENTFVAVAEARLVDYARMKLNPLEGHALVSALSSPVKFGLPMTTPWRVIMVAGSPGKLLENNHLLLNLNDPCAIEDTSWIKPGKVIREVTLTTIGGKACVDFAAEHGLQYVEFDAGWYGHEYADDSDATTVTVDPKRSPGPLDLEEVIRYAEERGIGILLYVNRRALERQIDEVLPLLERWGVKGVKYGFVQVGSQEWTAWLHDAVRKAADHKLMVDVHDEYRPTGYSRTFPNLMTQEGIAGDETSPSSEQTLTILFTRMLAGAGDNTVCYYDPRVKCHAYQLAKAVCLYSPWQFLYWYDRPEASPRKKGGAGGSQNVIGDEPELEFFGHLPTVWDETRVIHGKIGRYAAIARRSGGDWYIGCMNGNEARTLAIPLDFLEEGKKYEAHVYGHDESVETRTKVRIDRFAVNSGTVLEVALPANGGEAVRIVEKSLVLEGEGCRLHVNRESHRIELMHGDSVILTSPPEGLWSIAKDWEDDWPVNWIHAQPEDAVLRNGWLLLTGKLGNWELRDAYHPAGSAFKCVRRFIWQGPAPARRSTLSVRWQMPRTGAEVVLPGICYHGNPSGVKSEFGHVAMYDGKPGEELLCEEHRFPMPFAALEWQGKFGAALHTVPSLAAHANVRDQWWSLGVRAPEDASELLLLSGPCTINGERSFVKANQRRLLKYPDMWLDVPPGAVIEKTFYLESYPVETKGSGFRQPLRTSIDLFKPFDAEAFPTMEKIVEAKRRFTLSRWHEDAESAGFRMYPHNNEYVMGWAGQSGAPGYALLVLDEDTDKAVRAMNHLATSPFNEQGFMVRYDPDNDRWYGQDPVSQGQGMENFARAILAGRKRDDVDTDRWEAFLGKACDIHADRILNEAWRPRSTSEGFLVSPLCKAFSLFGKTEYRKAAIKAAEHYASRHLDMTEPYWGGTLDARCEDKEGAWAGFQAFLAAYEMTGMEQYLEWATHAMDVALTYTVVWDIDLPPGRLRDHALKTRGWTVVSAQNQHLDVYGVVYTPDIYRMGEYLGRDDLKKLALVMYRSCGQMIDPSGSQGEQLNHTNFAQWGDLDDVHSMRGAYSEGWTVYWITAHFLNAAAQFEEMGLRSE